MSPGRGREAGKWGADLDVRGFSAGRSAVPGARRGGDLFRHARPLPVAARGAASRQPAGCLPDRVFCRWFCGLGWVVRGGFARGVGAGFEDLREALADLAQAVVEERPQRPRPWPPPAAPCDREGQAMQQGGEFLRQGGGSVGHGVLLGWMGVTGQEKMT